MRLKQISGMAFMITLGCAALAAAQLKPGERVGMIGDSITEQKIYTVDIEDYLLMCQPQPGVRTMQFGWGGETSWGFLARVDRDYLPFKTDVATICFGMNDGGYAPLTPAVSEKYKHTLEQLLDALHSAGVRAVLGSAGCVDTKTFRNNPDAAAAYNQTLASLRDLARDVAKEKNVPFADVYQPMHDVMQQVKAKYGADYPLAGADGVHPNANGHLVMAYAFLKALGCDGDLGTINLDLQSASATASGGHTVKSFEGGTLTLESTRYPFCFLVPQQFADKLDNPNNPRGVLPLLPFNQELNRFTLIVTHAPTKMMKLTWGAESKTFSDEQLAKGINLAAEFLDNPLEGAFARVDALVRTQQNFETTMIKQLVHQTWAEMPDEHDLLKQMTAATSKRQKEYSDAAASAVVPVTHMIRIEAVQ